MTGQQLRTELRTSLKLTTELKNSLETLQLSGVEFEELINKYLSENPFLSCNHIAPAASIANNYLRYNHQLKSYSSDYDPLSNILAFVSLKDHLQLQLPLLIKTELEQKIALYLIDQLDNDGYLRTNKSEIADQLKLPLNKLEEIINSLQQLEPTGVFASDLTECLKLQLIERRLYDSIFEIILSNLELIANGEIKKLAKLAKIDSKALAAKLKILKTLEPKPGRNFFNEQVQIKIPDIFVQILPNGAFSIELNNSYAGAIIIDKEYYQNLRAKIKQAKDRSYITEQFQQASNFIWALNQREKTILKVTEAIISEQEEFFKRGILYLKPLTLNRIAELTELNESTISRTVNNKYIAAPQGIFEIKYFFSSKVKSKYNEEGASSLKVKELIKSLIEAEDHRQPLSDIDIATQLQHFNITIARRTVSKYREALKIPTSTKRLKTYRLKK